MLSPVYGSDGGHIGFVKITRDLTERRDADLERERLVQATEAVRLRDEFLSIASHELRTPLMALQLQLQSLHELYGAHDTKLVAKLDRADRSARRMSELVDALFDVTRIASGKLTIHPQPSDLGEIVADVAERMQEAAAGAKCTLVAAVERDVVGDWDPLRMGQVVSNLLSNASKYAAATAIELTLRTAGDRAIMTVADRGPGIATEHHERVFGRFERASDPRHHGGLGLGLYVTQQIVNAHGGDIRVSNRDGGGALLTVNLPRKGVRT